jgi:hypothetical protein
MKKARNTKRARKTTGAKRARRPSARPKRVARAARRSTSRPARKSKPASRSRARTSARSKSAPKSRKAPAKSHASPPPLIRKGLPVTKAALRRMGKSRQLGERPEIKTIIVYTTEQKPKNLYPRRIISPPLPSACCTNENRTRLGKVYEELGRHYYYKRCNVCGHAVKYYFNIESEFDTPKLRKYYEWKKSVFH